MQKIKWGRNFLVAVISIVVIFSGYKLLVFGKNVVKINGNKIKVEIANTAETRYKGLSDRDYLCENCGMLFVFDNKDARTFVMRDMRFNLDIIWLVDGKIAKIDKNLPAEGANPQKLYNSVIAVSSVLEVNANYCDKHNIKIGDSLTLY